MRNKITIFALCNQNLYYHNLSFVAAMVPIDWGGAPLNENSGLPISVIAYGLSLQHALLFEENIYCIIPPFIYDGREKH